MKINARLLTILWIAIFSGFLSIRGETITINFQKVFEEYNELKVEDQKLREEVAVFQQEQQVKVEDLQARQQEFNEMRNRAAQLEVTEAERKEMVQEATEQLEELNRLEQELRNERTQFQKDLEAKGLRLRRGIVDKVNEKIKEMAEENGWELVIDSSAKSPNGLPVISYSVKALDKTDLLIRVLNTMSKSAADSAE